MLKIRKIRSGISELLRCRKALLCLVALLCASSIHVLAQSTIAGVVVDSADASLLQGATVRVLNTSVGAISSRKGQFVFHGLRSGSYVVDVTLLGYTHAKVKCSVSDKDSIFLRIELVPQAIQSSEIVVSANKRVQAVQDVPLSIAVVDASALANRNSTKLDEALRYVPGVNVAQSQVDIRGTSGFAYGLGSRTSLLLDNFPMLSADNGDISFDALPMFAINRIEIVKGSGSALYGSGAIGGVVNVITKDAPPEALTQLRAYSGAYTKPRYDDWVWTQRLLRMEGIDASYAKSFGPFSIVTAAGIRADDTHLQDADSFRSSLYCKATYAPSTASQFMIFGQYAYEDHANFLNWQNVQHATMPVLNVNGVIRIFSSKLALGTEYKTQIDESSFAVFRGSVYRTWYNNSAPATSTDFLASTATVFNTEGQFTTYVNPKIALTAGINITANNVESQQTNGNQLQLIAAGYGQTEFSNLDDIIVTLGGRIDVEKTRNENKNIELSPKLGISYKAMPGTNLRLSVGRSFRAPSVMERYATIRFAGFTVGHNINLKPEKGWSFEVGGEQTFSLFNLPWNLDLTLFQNELYELIEPQFVVSSTKSEIQFVNVTRARIQGVEADVKTWIIPKLLGVQSSLTLMNPIDLSTNTTLTYRHKLMWISGLMATWNNFEFQLDYRYLSRQETADERIVNLGLVVNGDIRVPIHVVDARIIYDLQKASLAPLRITLNARNLLDYYYVEIPGNLAATRSLSIQLDVSF